MLPTSLSFLLRCTIPYHSPWKPQSDKSRVRAEPGEPKAPLFVEAFSFAHGFLTGDNDGMRYRNNRGWEYAYVETTYYGQTVRGFVPLDCVLDPGY